jgi:hypothetical protein
VKRSKSLPDGGNCTAINFKSYIETLTTAWRHATKAPQQMTRDPEAREAWYAVYEHLTEGKPGLPGQLLARAEAQVLRLSMLYALLDASPIITAPHLYAALALWEYVEASVAHVFGATTGDPHADMLKTALRDTYPQAMTKTQVSAKVFQRNVPVAVIDRAIQRLLEEEAITFTKEGGGRQGRPSEVVRYNTNYEKNEKNIVRVRGYVALARSVVEELQGGAPSRIPKKENYHTNEKNELNESAQQKADSSSNGAANPPDATNEISPQEIRNKPPVPYRGGPCPRPGCDSTVLMGDAARGYRLHCLCGWQQARP